MGQAALPEADREPGGGTELLSLSQQQLTQEFQQPILKQAAVLTLFSSQSVLALPHHYLCYYSDSLLSPMAPLGHGQL